ncbi:hypothetical protein RI367_002742 [Sorochytrium milnesiophthora]
MADAVQARPAATTQAPRRQGQAQQNGQPEMSWTDMLRMIVLAYLFSQFVARMFLSPASDPAATLATAADHVVATATGDSAAQAPVFLYSVYKSNWLPTQEIDLYVYLSEDERFSQFNDRKALVWTQTALRNNDWDVHVKKDINVTLSDHLRHNGSMFAHVYVTKTGVSPNPLDDSYVMDDLVHKSYMLTQYMQQKKVVQKKKLIRLWESADSDVEDKNETLVASAAASATDSNDTLKIVSYWNGNLTINTVPELPEIIINKTPEQMHKFIEPRQTVDMSIQPKGATTPTVGVHAPILYLNDFWTLESHFIPLDETNDTMTALPLHLEFYPITMFKFQLYVGMADNFKKQKDNLGSTGSELDEVKRVLLETNPWFLALTMTVSMLHSAFEFLAFKNDIQFWKNREDVRGISVRSIIINLFFQVVIFLYLVDNQQNTSWMILISNGIGLAIEFWKAGQAVKISVDRTGSFPRFRIGNKQSYSESKTKEYDDQAFRYLSYVVYPCLVGYTVYSLLYDEHKNWYSFVLNTLVGYVYAFGFIMMTPQLFINYKLKSVAHMNGRTMIYKFLTTIVDDLFSFIIKMPTWHRIACFRDDVVFLVYLYQRWIYPVDKTRVNEFGQGGDDKDKKAAVSPTADTSATKDAESKKNR